MNTPKKMIRVANAQGFWGDSLLGPKRLVEEGPVDYLTFDYLSEITMSIMQKQRMRDPESGYARDFIKMLKMIMPQCKDKGIKLIANAAGVNAPSCLSATKLALSEIGLQGIRIGIVEGDDILNKLDVLINAGEELVNIDTGAALASVKNDIISANVYIGAASIVDALQQDADIVITGRASDPSLAVAPLVYEFGWSFEDFDKIASATVLGHIIECGPQCTGGNYTDWRDVQDFAHIGFPVAEAYEDGSFVVTKHEGTGGLINVESVTSQLLYELGDPARYLSPDCIADFTSIHMEQDGPDRVRVHGVKGLPPTDSFKVSMSFANGYKILATLCISGPDAVEKAHIVSDMVFTRMKMLGADIPEDDRFLELFGNNVLYKGIVESPDQPHEILMRLGAKGMDADKLNVMSSEIAPVLTSGPPGVTGFAAGRSRASEVVGYWPALINKDKIETTVKVEEV